MAQKRKMVVVLNNEYIVIYLQKSDLISKINATSNQKIYII